MKSIVASVLALGAVVVNAAAISPLVNAAAVSPLVTCLNKANVTISTPGGANYSELAEPFNLRLQYSPVVIVLPRTTKHVSDAVVCAAECNVKVQAKSGGHSYASFSSGGKNGSMVIDLQPLQDVEVDANGIAKVGGGVRLGNLADKIYKQAKRAVSHGTCPGVGVGGHFTHGGYGHTSRNWGLALDHIVGVDVVLANGTAVYATQTLYPDVFWAIRGAADSFGIVTNFYLETHEAPESVTYFSYKWGSSLFSDKQAFTDTFLHIQDFATNATIIDSRISFGIYLDGVAAYNLGGTFFGTVDEFKATYEPELLRGIPTPTVPVIVDKYAWYDYLILMSDKTSIIEPLTGYDEHDTFFTKSITVPETQKLSATALDAFWTYIHQPAPVDYFVIINLYGGPGSQINTKDTSFAAYNDRDSLWVFQNYGIGADSIDWIQGLNQAVVQAQPNTTFGAYLNYVDPSLTPAEAHTLYYGEALYAKLLALKGEVDPGSVFWNPQAIGTV
ncbi:Glucooligosaccharide oxidase [Pleomassaria siparia CBS 279.74]|uniref:Glucooligosaccharide oxidase n=1 Tax=Pleomassaria siparia CBS 279.74 TaxID=1314801 RepID=A0A6G1KE73_9PLEO|nr:Glucooligosaccharide oxidase [Pleomassaria siparia CBS 279.74]